MSKKKKNQMNDAVITSEEMAYMQDEELRNLQDTLRKERDYGHREGYNTRNAEITMCYVQRELGIREQRKVAHFSYLKKHGIVESDYTAPTADELSGETGDASQGLN